MSNDLKKYEISFLIREESDKDEIVKTVVSNNGSITNDGNVSKIKLAYPIKKEASLYFGHFIFSAAQEIVKKIENNLKINSKVLRFLILTPPIVKSLEVRTRADRFAGIKTEQKMIKKTEKPEVRKAEVKTSLSNEELEKKLEEILK